MKEFKEFLKLGNDLNKALEKERKQAPKVRFNPNYFNRRMRKIRKELL